MCLVPLKKICLQTHGLERLGHPSKHSSNPTFLFKVVCPQTFPPPKAPLLSNCTPPSPPLLNGQCRKGGEGGEECRQNRVRMGECRRGEQCMCSETDPVSADPQPCREKVGGGGVKNSPTLDDQKASPLARGHVTVLGHSASAGTVFPADSSCDRDGQRAQKQNVSLRLRYLRRARLLGGLRAVGRGSEIARSGGPRRGSGVRRRLFCIVLKEQTERRQVGRSSAEASARLRSGGH